MASRSMSAVVLVWAVLVRLAACSMYSKMNLPTSTSPYSPGNSALGLDSPACLCGPNSYCSPSSGSERCICADGYVGTPPSCRPTDELWRLCFAGNPCGLHAECEVHNGVRRCPYCLYGYNGSPPNCVAPDECRNVERRCGPNAEWDLNYAQSCVCAQGFVGEPPNCTAGPVLLARCDPYPCGAFSDCRMQNGRPVCTCARDCEGKPPHCKPGPELWRVCIKDKPCGPYSKCEMKNRVAVCSPCDPGYTGTAPSCYKTVHLDHFGFN